MASRRLEIVLHSANDLYDVKHFGTMDPYAMLWVAEGGRGMVSEQCKTEVAKKVGSCPVWNYPMRFQLKPTNNSYILFCEIKHDLLAGDASREKVGYPLRTPSGEVKGEIILSHKFTVGKVCRPRKKVPKKKKHGMIKKIAKTVVTEAALLVGGLGAAYILGEIFGQDVENDYQNEDEADGDADADEDADVDEDADEDAEADADEDEDEEEY
ncbi:protein SRC2-like [Helianthus annuus]|uniref:protein SRC2-like n=1 Tax=Helianthus annuus TaxID=4232 RepID=UPI000B9077FD|nr:protein SRC2-like [Helianthus annuus]